MYLFINFAKYKCSIQKGFIINPELTKINNYKFDFLIRFSVIPYRVVN